MKDVLNYIIKSRLKKLEPKPKKRFEIEWKKTDINSLEFLHKEATLRAQDTVLDHYEITKKAFSLLLLMITLSSALIGFLLTKNEFNTLYVVVIIALPFCLVSIYILSELIRPNKFRAPGRVPNIIMTNKYFDEKVSEEERKKRIVYNELLNCQAKIELNQFYNTARLKVIDSVIRLLLLTFITLGIILLLSKTV